MKLKKKSGFTLIEVLIVLIVLGILAALAVPLMTGATNRAYKAEALRSIDATREAMYRYKMDPDKGANKYTGATIPTTGTGTVDFNPNQPGEGQTTHFDYTLALTDTTFIITAAPKSTTGLTGLLTVNQAGVKADTLA